MKKFKDLIVIASLLFPSWMVFHFKDSPLIGWDVITWYGLWTLGFIAGGIYFAG